MRVSCQFRHTRRTAGVKIGRNVIASTTLIKDQAVIRLIGKVAEALRARLPGALVETAHMEIAPPSIADAVETCVTAGAESIVIHPYFLAQGRHTRETIPEKVAEARQRHPGVNIRITEHLGFDESLVRLVQKRIEAANRSD